VLEQSYADVRAIGADLAFVELRSRLQELTVRYGLFTSADHRLFYPTLDAALGGIGADAAPASLSAGD
jgi:hypothetical protein